MSSDTEILDRIEASKQVLEGSRRRNPPHVLVIEDRVADREWLCHQLVSIGCEVTEAKSGFEANRNLDLKTFHLILLDLGLPDIDGAKLIEICRAKCPYAPVAVVTGSQDEKTRQKVFECGAIMLFPKPWTKTDCLQLLSLFNLTNALTYGANSPPFSIEPNHEAS